MALLFTPSALADLAGIWQYSVQQWDEQQADDYLSGLYAAIDRLTDFPLLGALRTEFTPPVRILANRQHIIIYRVDGADILIIRVRHAREDWQSDSDTSGS